MVVVGLPGDRRAGEEQAVFSRDRRGGWGELVPARDRGGGGEKRLNKQLLIMNVWYKHGSALTA